MLKNICNNANANKSEPADAMVMVTVMTIRLIKLFSFHFIFNRFVNVRNRFGKSIVKFPPKIRLIVSFCVATFALFWHCGNFWRLFVERNSAIACKQTQSFVIVWVARFAQTTSTNAYAQGCSKFNSFEQMQEVKLNHCSFTWNVFYFG